MAVVIKTPRTIDTEFVLFKDDSLETIFQPMFLVELIEKIATDRPDLWKEMQTDAVYSQGVDKLKTYVDFFDGDFETALNSLLIQEITSMTDDSYYLFNSNPDKAVGDEEYYDIATVREYIKLVKDDTEED